MLIFDLFEKEGLLDDYNKLSNKNLLHVEDFLKKSRDAAIEPNTIVFGTVNRLHLIKNKMKNNKTFHENVECVEIKNLLAWCEGMRSTYGAASADDNDTHTESSDNSNDESNSTAVVTLEKATDDSSQDLSESPVASDTPLVESTDTDEPKPPEVKHDGKFKFAYLAKPVPVSAISSGFSIYDHNPKELAYAFIKNLSAN